MPDQTIFYSWQSDLPAEVCRSLIEVALKRAAKRLCRECTLTSDPRVDRDTKGEPGSPDIAKTIETKIAAAQAFVGALVQLDSVLRELPDDSRTRQPRLRARGPGTAGRSNTRGCVAQEIDSICKSL